MNENIEVSGLLYKKRGGFGKIMPNAWQYRYFTISREGMLCYYDTEVPDAAMAESKARGRLDLSCVNYELNLDQIEGAPTVYSIQVCPPGEEKWKMCAETKEDHARWCKTLDKFQHEKKLKPALGSPVSYSSDDDAEQKRNRSRVNSGRLGVSSDALPTSSTDPIDTISKVSLEESPLNRSDQRSLPAAVTTTTVKSSVHNRKRLKLGNKAEMISSDSLEMVLVLVILNICFYSVASTALLADVRQIVCVCVANFVVAHTLALRAGRTTTAAAAALLTNTTTHDIKVDTSTALHPSRSESVRGAAAAGGESSSYASTTVSEQPSAGTTEVVTKREGKPNPGTSITRLLGSDSSS